MTQPILLCTDGSDLSIRALAAGLALLPDPVDAIVVTVAEETDPMLVTGSGHAGGGMTPDELDQLDQRLEREAQEVVTEVAAALGLADSPTHVLRGNPGPSVCQFAADLPARAIVIGSRGRGGIKRALLGSVSDVVVRNAPCPVIVTGPED